MLRLGSRGAVECASVEAFAMMMTSSTILPFDVSHAIHHAGSIADQACCLSGDKSNRVRFFDASSRRAFIGIFPC